MSVRDDYDIHEWDIYGYPGWFLFGDNMYIPDEYMNERWLPIENLYNYYWVSNYARVWSVKSHNFLKVKPMDSHGHLGVCLYIEGKTIYRYIHRLVAQAFIPNPHNLPIVRHIDDDPSMNEVDYLAWGTQKDNIHDFIRNGKAHIITDEDREKGLCKTRIPISATNKQTEKTLHFCSQTEASRVLKIQQSNIWKVLNKKRPFAGGYSFEYLPKENVQ